jgi:ribosomal protein L37AE/L43A
MMVVKIEINFTQVSLCPYCDTEVKVTFVSGGPSSIFIACEECRKPFAVGANVWPGQEALTDDE